MTRGTQYAVRNLAAGAVLGGLAGLIAYHLWMTRAGLAVPGLRR